MEFDFSIIISTFNSELGIKKSIDSIINQTHAFKKIEIIIVDNNSDDKTKDICDDYIKKYAHNIKYFQLDENDFVRSINLGIEQSSGTFIASLQPHDYYSKNTLQEIWEFANKNKDVDVISIPLVFFKNNKKWNYLNYKIKKSKKVNLLNEPKYVQFLGLSTFIRRNSIEGLKFKIPHNQGPTIFSEILMNNPTLGITNNGAYFSRNIDEKIYSINEESFFADDYENYIEINFSRLIEKTLNKFSNVPQFIQFNLINHLRWLLYAEKTPEKLDLTKLSEKIKYIDDEIILNNKLLPRNHKIFTCLLKHDFELSEDLKEKLELNTIFIDNYDIINDKLHLLASKLTTELTHVDIFVNGEKINAHEVIFPQKDEYSLNCRYAKDYSIETAIPINTNEEFELEFKQGNKKLHIDFSRPCNFSKTVGYAKTKHYLSLLNNDSIIIKKKTTGNWIKQELKALVHIVKERETGFEKAVPFRIIYMLAYPFLRNKKIWFYMDRPDESDDNGLALFKYSMKQNEKIDKYFILDSHNKEFDNIKKIGKVIPYKSIKHRILGLFVENIITSHPDNEIIYPFWGGYPFFAGLLKSNNIFLQHGILKDDISSWLNKSNMNLSFFLVSSAKEYESIFTYPYNYDKNVVQLLGLPRYDTLENQKDKKQIIIMPSWRRDLDHKSNEYVKNNEFFKKFNSLINNERLIEKARENNYEIIFRPHPKVYAYIGLFDRNDYVKIDYDKERYQTLFNNGSLMITDYSSVSFDFAYLYKPVLYYQYGDDYHFDIEDSYFDYETMGFGEVVKTEEELVDLTIKYIEKNCELDDEYAKRISDFFIFTDKNNCKRVHDKIKEMPLKD